MIYQPVEKLLPKADGSVYTLSILAGKRAQELASGQPKLIDAPANEKLATTALREIIAGKVVSKVYAEVLEKAVKVVKGKK